MSPHESFCSRISKMEGYLETLQTCEALPVVSSKIPSVAAIYAFYDGDTVCYVGRSGDKQKLRKRIKNHQGLTHNAASYVYKRTCVQLGLLRVYKKGEGGTRSERMNDSAFREEFLRQRDILLKMSVRYVEIDDQIDQYLFELYATLHFGLDTSGFGTH